MFRTTLVVQESSFRRLNSSTISPSRRGRRGGEVQAETVRSRPRRCTAAPGGRRRTPRVSRIRRTAENDRSVSSATWRSESPAWYCSTMKVLNRRRNSGLGRDGHPAGHRSSMPAIEHPIAQRPIQRLCGRGRTSYGSGSRTVSDCLRPAVRSAGVQARAGGVAPAADAGPGGRSNRCKIPGRLPSSSLMASDLPSATPVAAGSVAQFWPQAVTTSACRSRPRPSTSRNSPRTSG